MYTEGHEGRSHGVAATTKDAVSADRRVGDRRACKHAGASHVGPFFGHATPDRAGARPYRVKCRVARCDMGLHPFLWQSGDIFSRVSRAVLGLNQSQLHLAGFADHVLVPRRIPH